MSDLLWRSYRVASESGTTCLEGSDENNASVRVFPLEVTGVRLATIQTREGTETYNLPAMTDEACRVVVEALLGGDLIAEAIEKGLALGPLLKIKSRGPKIG